MESIEIRVRPVIRYNVTQYKTGPNSGSCESLGEFPSEAAAEFVAQAVEERGAQREYAIVEETPGQMNPLVFYAYSPQEVNQRLIELAATPEPKGFRVFSRIRDMRIPA